MLELSEELTAKQVPILITKTELVESDVAEYSAAEDEANDEPTEETKQEAKSFIESHMVEDVARMRKMIEFPELMSLLQTAKIWLQMIDFSVYQFERMFSFPQCSDMLNNVMTALLCTECERRRIQEIPSMPYEVWMPRLKQKVSRWYSWYELRPSNKDTVFDIHPSFWKTVGENNPLETKNLHEITFVHRVLIFKALCDSMLSKHPVLINMCATMEAVDLRDHRDLGKDAAGNRFFHLRTLAEDDLRVYRVARGEADPESESETLAALLGKDLPKPKSKKKRRGRPKKIQPTTEEIAPDPEIEVPNNSMLSVSSYIAETGDFELVVDSLQTLRELIATYQTTTKNPSRPQCEVDLLTKLEELLTDFEEFDEQLDARLQDSQCEIYIRWHQYQERPDDFVDPDIVSWEKPKKPSRSSTPVPFTAAREENSSGFEPVRCKEEQFDTPTTNVTAFTPEVTRSGRKITSRISSLLEYCDLSEDSDANDVWTVPGKKKVTKPRLPKIQEEGTENSKPKKKRGRKRKFPVETNLPEVEIVNAAVPSTNPADVSTNPASVSTSAITSTNTGPTSNSFNILPNTNPLPNPESTSIFAPSISTPVKTSTFAPPVSNSVNIPTLAILVSNPVSVTGKAPNIGPSTSIVSSSNGSLCVDITSLLRSSPAIPGRPCNRPATQNGGASTNKRDRVFTPTSIRTSNVPVRTPPSALRSPGDALSTPKIKRTPVRRRLTVSPATTICNGATSITAAPTPPKISSQVTVLMVKKQSEVIVIDSDEDDIPAIRLPSSCSLVRVRKQPPQAPLVPRLPPSISVTAINNITSRQPAPAVEITISDDEDEDKPVYRVVISGSGQNYARVLPDGRLQVLKDEEVAQIRAKNNGRLV